MINKAIGCWSAVLLAALFGLNASNAAPTLRSLQIEAQSPTEAYPGGLVYFSFSVSRTGSGSMSAYLSVTGLPPGATNYFDPPELTFDDLSPSTKYGRLVIRLDPLTPPGSYPITISAQKGNSPQAVSATAILVVSGTTLLLTPPVLDIPVLNADGTLGLSGIGTRSQLLIIEATTNLAVPNSWVIISVQTLDESGFFALVDTDRTNYPARFYRAVQ